MNSSTEVKSLSSRSGARLAASAAKPEAIAAELRRKLRRFMRVSVGARSGVDGSLILMSFRGFVRPGTTGSKRVRPRGRFLRWKLWRVGIVAGDAVLTLKLPGRAGPGSADSPMGTGLPVAEGRPMATATKRGTFQ